MEAQRDRARAAVKDDSWSTYGGVLSDIAKDSGATEFVGYERDEVEAHVIALLHEGVVAQRIEAGQQGDIVLDTTAFYGEQGGQVGDTGVIETATGARFVVEDTKITGGVITHAGRLETGNLQLGDVVLAKIDVLRRERIRRNHTATHLLHWALRLVLGEHAKQSGSYVAPDRLRFDFTHYEAMTREQLSKVERLVNAKIFENHAARAYETSIASAREAGVTALFGEKYGNFVRVLEVGNFSKELCGGTHVGRTSEIGFLKVLNESSVGANLRRIEAVTSFDAYEYVAREEGELIETADALKIQRFDVSERTVTLLAKVKELESRADRTKQMLSEGSIAELVEGAIDVGYPLLVARIAPTDTKQLRNTTDVARARMTGGAVVFASTDAESGKALLIAAGSDEAVAKGFHAGNVIKAMAAAVDGRGGGKPDMAQGGGDNAAAIDDALQVARDTLGAT
jgi:alanyl-tRNA synthetase